MPLVFVGKFWIKNLVLEAEEIHHIQYIDRDDLAYEYCKVWDDSDNDYGTIMVGSYWDMIRIYNTAWFSECIGGGYIVFFDGLLHYDLAPDLETLVERSLFAGKCDQLLRMTGYFKFNLKEYQGMKTYSKMLECGGVTECCSTCGKENDMVEVVEKCEHCGDTIVACHACTAWELESYNRCVHCDNGSLFIEYKEE